VASDPGSSPPRVAILGPGGIGGLLGVVLARQGAAVTCLAPPATAAHLAEHGLELRSPMLGDAHVRVRAATRLAEPVDLCLVTVKATQLTGAAEAVPPAALNGGLVVPFLNGVDHVAWLRRRYPPDQVAAGTIRIESTRVAPGVIEHASPFAVVELAGPPARRAAVDDLAALLRAGGLQVTVREDEAFTLWAKLAVLAPIALLTTWTAAPLGEARQRHPELAAALVREVTQAAKADGVALDEQVGARMMAGAPATMRSSMQKDAAAGRPLELDAIGGAVLRAAARAGVEAPVTARLVAELRDRYPER
jgi:2-dehydropantoate 2-reductase